MSVQLTKFEWSERIAEGTMAFHFGKPNGFQFRAGQAIDITLVNPPETDAEGNTRGFSIVSAPSESDLTIATRMRDTAFKRSLRGFKAGTEVQIDGPFGSLTLHKNAEKPAVFLAGGIGITPFISILREAAIRQLPHQLILFYSNRRPEDAPFLEELRSLHQKNSRFVLIPTMSQIERSQQPWAGETGQISAKMLSRHVESIHGRIFYIAGPPGMVAALRNMLSAAGVDEDDVRTEEFVGYSTWRSTQQDPVTPRLLAPLTN
jgi:ferredoxin-NADP reductase